jgi:DUF2934 family protein
MKKKAHAKDEQPTSNALADDQIAERAYEIFLARGATHGQDIEDWLRAEGELCAPRGTDDPA